MDVCEESGAEGHFGSVRGFAGDVGPDEVFYDEEILTVLHGVDADDLVLEDGEPLPDHLAVRRHHRDGVLPVLDVQEEAVAPGPLRGDYADDLHLGFEGHLQGVAYGDCVPDVDPLAEDALHLPEAAPEVFQVSLDVPLGLPRKILGQPYHRVVLSCEGFDLGGAGSEVEGIGAALLLLADALEEGPV